VRIWSESLLWSLIRLDRPSLRRSRLSWLRQNYIRAETLTRANAALVAFQNRVRLAHSWGGGDVASADGLRFVVPIRTIHSGPNPHYFGQERGGVVGDPGIGQTSSGLRVTISSADFRWTSASRSRFLGNRLRLA
jgi:hypothetical protein